ncbi:hypothetical protein K2Y11_21410 [bacterium]|nr:hypothetical protein [bacterium]
MWIRSKHVVLSAVIVFLAITGCRSSRSQLTGTASKDTSRSIERELVADKSVEETGKPNCPLKRGEVAALKRPSRATHPTTVPEDAGADSITQTPSTPFSPKGLCPISPAERMAGDSIPSGYQARLDELSRVGTQLAKGAQGTDVKFHFDAIYNPRRASTCHTEAGHILVTSSLLERVQTRHQLATALALEMAEYIREQDAMNERRAALAGEVSQDAKLSDKSFASDKPTEKEVNEAASQLLARAGFEQIDVVAMRQDLNGLFAGTMHAAARPRSDSTMPEPKWNGPRPSTAN